MRGGRIVAADAAWSGVALAVAALVAVLGWAQGAAQAIVVKTGIALAVAAVPEALPAVVTIALAVALHRMARRRALVRRLPAVEALGSTAIVCTDKTRTLTSGEMTASRLWTAGGVVPLDPNDWIVVLAAASAPTAAGQFYKWLTQPTASGSRRSAV